MVVSAVAPGGRCKESPHLSKQNLSASRANLLELMQSINFGQIERLVIEDGEPVLAPRPSVVHEHKFGGENGARPEVSIEDFVLKDRVIELFAFFDEFGDGVVHLLEIQHGLPFRMILREDAA